MKSRKTHSLYGWRVARARLLFCALIGVAVILTRMIRQYTKLQAHAANDAAGFDSFEQSFWPGYSSFKFPLHNRTVDSRNFTDAGVDVSNPELYTGFDLMGDSSTTTVIGMATGYGLDVFERFIGSLRKTGYKGHIILGVEADLEPKYWEYFACRNVTAKPIQWVQCVYPKDYHRCSHHYPDMKIQYSRFPLARDWLLECADCTGPVLFVDVRDTLFQLDPFGPGAPLIQGLQVYEETPIQLTSDPFVHEFVWNCKGIEFERPMLCSGSTIGTRAAMLKYLEVMYAEMKVWVSQPQCRFDSVGDDQSVHNYLFYTGQLPFGVAVPNRMGGIVNTIGIDGGIVYQKHLATIRERNPHFSDEEARNVPYDGATNTSWLDARLNFTDEMGRFIDYDGSLSRVVHQWDRFNTPYEKLWLVHQPFVQDPVPILSSNILSFKILYPFSLLFPKSSAEKLG